MFPTIRRGERGISSGLLRDERGFPAICQAGTDFCFRIVRYERMFRSNVGGEGVFLAREDCDG